MHVTTLSDLLTWVPVMHITVRRLRTHAETGGLVVHITEIYHHLQEARSVSDETVEMRRGNKWIAVTNLRVRTLLEGNPHVRILFPVFIIQLDVVLELILRKDVL